MPLPALKYPNIKVELTGQDSNAFFILGRCSGAMKKAGLSKEERDAFHKEATAGDYDHLLRTCMTWFDCE